MKRIRVKIGAILMLFAMMVSDGAVVLSMYFLAAAVHECGHLLAAKVLRIGIHEIRFDFSGVRICLKDATLPYRDEFILAAAGPCFNLLSITISLIALVGLRASPESAAESVLMLFDGRLTGTGMLAFLALASAVQGIINLLPINTLDGGRMIYCFTALTLGERCASFIIRATSFAAAFVMWTVALYLLLRVSNGLAILVFAVSVFISTVGENKKATVLS